MATGMQQSKQPVSALLTGPYGHPLHPTLVTVPIGAGGKLAFRYGVRVADEATPAEGFAAGPGARAGDHRMSRSG